jgi:tRNA 2-thiocytidine biosynthesis protein TtcA
VRQIGRAAVEYGLIEDGDRIMVGVSGGKDSFTLLHCLRVLARRAPVRFTVTAVTLDQGHPGFPAEALAAWYRDQGYEHRIVREDTYSIVKEKIAPGRTTCSLCSRLRRGILYNVAVEMGMTKIALGHHRDDLIETLLLNLFYSGQIKSMPPRLVSDDGRNVVIRPLCLSAEEEIAAFAREAGFPIIPCDLCGSQENLRRKRVKRLIADLAGEHADVPGNLLAALSNVRPSHLLDRQLQARLGGAAGESDDIP